MYILHLAEGNNVFFDDFVSKAKQFQWLENKFVVNADKEAQVMVKSADVLFAKMDTPYFKECIGDINAYDVVFIHYLSDSAINFVNEAPSNVKFAWIFFGADAFDLDPFWEGFLQPLTKKLSLKNNAERTLQFTIRPFQMYRNIAAYRKHKMLNKAAAKAISRMSYFCHFVHSDFLLVKEKYKMKATFVEYNYGDYNSYEYAIPPGEIVGENILLGHSASCMNNHLELIRMLSLCETGNRKVYMPLSYSAISYDYLQTVINYGKEKFGDRFYPITDFLPRKEYISMMQDCGFVFFNQWRSHAGANIIFALCGGKKVFLSEKNPFYGFFSQLGATVFSIEKELINTNLSLWNKIDGKLIEENKAAVDSFFAKEKVMRRYENMFKQLAQA